LGRLKIETRTVKLADIASLWDIELAAGERLVVTI